VTATRFAAVFRETTDVPARRFAGPFYLAGAGRARSATGFDFVNQIMNFAL
jgi:hypothetical protein